MAKYAIVRDDDPNFFTSAKQLDAVYGEIFSFDVPVSSCVIPCIETGLKLKNVTFYGKNLEFEPFIPVEIRNVNEQFVLNENHELVEYFKNSKSHLNILQHGFSHALHEFASMNFWAVERRILEGRKIMQQTFNEAPNFFSAPYDLYSPISLLVLRRYFYGATCGEIKLKTMLDNKIGVRLPLDMIPSYVKALHEDRVFYSYGDFLMLGYSNTTRLSPFENSVLSEQAFKKYANLHEVIVLALHCWQFFCGEQKNVVGKTLDRKALESVIEKIQWLKSKGTKFLTMSQFYERFC